MLGTQKEDESCIRKGASRHEAAAGCGLPWPSLTVSKQFEENANHLDEKARQRIRARFHARWPSAFELGTHQQFSTADTAMHPKDLSFPPTEDHMEAARQRIRSRYLARWGAPLGSTGSHDPKARRVEFTPTLSSNQPFQDMSNRSQQGVGDHSSVGPP
jgi:hypothetical protein